jgi:hypothetical protein
LARYFIQRLKLCINRDLKWVRLHFGRIFNTHLVTLVRNRPRQTDLCVVGIPEPVWNAANPQGHDGDTNVVARQALQQLKERE